MSACRMIRGVGLTAILPVMNPLLLGIYCLPCSRLPLSCGGLRCENPFHRGNSKIAQGALPLPEAFPEECGLGDKPLDREGKGSRDVCKGRPEVFKLCCRFAHRAPDILPHIKHAHGYVPRQRLAQDDGTSLPVFPCKRLEHTHLAGIIAPTQG